MKDMLLSKSNTVAEVSQFRPGWSWCHPENRIAGLGCSQMMRPGTNTADARDNTRHLFHRPTQAELLKAPELHDIYPCILNITGIIQLNSYLSMSFNSGDRCNSYGLAW